MNDSKKPAKEELRKSLTDLQYKVTQENGTERAFSNEYWDNHEAGIYVDVISGEVLFSSQDKFDSGSGWPSFSQSLVEENIHENRDSSLGMERVEIRSSNSDSHLGHLFPDGPAPTGMRYCVNSASLRFIAVAALEKEGYGEYLKAFVNTETATLAAGCFWGVEELLRELDGVLETQVGYTGGHVDNPDYDDIRTGTSGHAESIRIVFDPAKLRYADLLDSFFRLHDPTTLNRQGNDRGEQYRSAIFTHSDSQKKEAAAAIQRADDSGRWDNPVITSVQEAGPWTDAEEYHQDYLDKNPGGYTCHFWRPE